MTFIRQFSPIAAAGLGVSQSSLQQIGEIYPQQGFGHADVYFYVNVVSGNLIIRDHVFKQKVETELLEFYYIYNSQVTDSKAAWRFSFQKQLSIRSAEMMVLTEPDGQEVIYTRYPQSDYYFAPKFGDGRAYLRLDQTNNQWIWHHPKTKVTEK